MPSGPFVPTADVGHATDARHPPRRPPPKGKSKEVGLRGREALRVKLFATELKGKTVMTEDGQLLGVLADFIMDTRSGRIESLLVTPAEGVEPRLFKVDPEGRLVLAFRSMKAIRDVIVTQLAD
jgi:sporulation protein YlmC with PRC-barrel domain